MRRIEIALMSAAAIAASVFLAFWPTGVADYKADAGPSLHPLIGGDFHAAFAHQPAMGWFAILFRAPVAFFARHADALLEYRLGNLPCVLVLTALGVWLAARARNRHVALVVLALAVLGPMNWHALADGHPEELLGAALCVAAVLSAASGRSPLAAGVILGLALATKQWAVLAAGPALLAAPRGRAQIAAMAIAVGGALTLLPVIAGSHHLLSPASSAALSYAAVQPASIWWPFAHVQHVAAPGWTVDHRSIPLWLANLTHPGIVILGLVLPLAVLRRTRTLPVSTETALTLLALLFLFRCLLDPMNVGYYQVPLLVSLVALEALQRRGLPLLSLISNAVMWVLVARIPWGLEPAKVATIYLAWALPLAAYLSLKLYAPSVISGLGKWLSTSLPSSVTTTRSSIRTPNAPGT
jgi:hypothetical protein